MCMRSLVEIHNTYRTKNDVIIFRDMPVIVYLLSEIKAPPDMYNARLAADVVLDF